MAPVRVFILIACPASPAVSPLGSWFIRWRYGDDPARSNWKAGV